MASQNTSTITKRKIGFRNIEIDRDAIHCIMNMDDQETHKKIFKTARKTGVDIRTMSPYRQSLEEVFLELVEDDTNGGQG